MYPLSLFKNQAICICTHYPCVNIHFRVVCLLILFLNFFWSWLTYFIVKKIFILTLFHCHFITNSYSYILSISDIYSLQFYSIIPPFYWSLCQFPSNFYFSGEKKKNTTHKNMTEPLNLAFFVSVTSTSTFSNNKTFYKAFPFSLSAI